MLTSDRPVRRRLARAFSAIALAVIVLLSGIWLGGHPSDLPSPLRGGFFESRRLVLVNQALNILTTRYYRPLKRSSLVDAGLSGMVASLDDPYSRYLDPDSYRERSEHSTQALGGIGINTVAEPPGLLVVSVLEHSPAAGAGLMSGDLIIKVGSTSLVDRAENLGSELIRGPVGTPVELTFLRDDVQHVVSVERANIVVPVATLQMLTYHHLRIGHLTLTGFTEGSGEQLRTEVQAAMGAGARALILDLRGNGGGLVGEAINVPASSSRTARSCPPRSAAKPAGFTWPGVMRSPPTNRWSFSSIMTRRRLPRSSPRRCRTAAEPRWSARKPTARASSR